MLPGYSDHDNIKKTYRSAGNLGSWPTCNTNQNTTADFVPPSWRWQTLMEVVAKTGKHALPNSKEMLRNRPRNVTEIRKYQSTNVPFCLSIYGTYWQLSTPERPTSQPTETKGFCPCLGQRCFGGISGPRCLCCCGWLVYALGTFCQSCCYHSSAKKANRIGFWTITTCVSNSSQPLVMDNFKFSLSISLDPSSCLSNCSVKTLYPLPSPSFLTQLKKRMWGYSSLMLKE